jgi:adenosylcobinamide-GDP ribazoletransferase
MSTPVDQNIFTVLLSDLRVAIGFITRLPVVGDSHDAAANPARAGRFYPVAGALVGAVVGLIYLALVNLGVPAIAAAALALGAGCWLTGALHEDGLADVADGFGGGASRERKLEIMRDSRIGVFGASALLVAFAAKLGVLVSIPATSALGVLIAVHALARAPLPLLSMWLPLARSDGLAAAVGETPIGAALVALAIGGGVALIALPFAVAGIAIAAVLAAACAVGLLARQQIGGRTGDVLGAAEQAAEVAALVAIAARLE